MATTCGKIASTTAGFTIFIIGIAFFVTLFLVAWSPKSHHSHRRSDPIKSAQERFTTQPLDHSHANSAGEGITFQQRYYWVPPPRPESQVIFFYAGNEASVEAYVNSCGMMWENAAEFNAALVFAEHRFWGKSVPKVKQFEYAGPDQAIDDYIALLDSLLQNETRKNNFKPGGERIKIVAFGGSYGGMLAAWMRLKHPKIIDAAVASSAPILAFPDTRFTSLLNRGFYRDGGAAYWRVVTKVFARCARGIHNALSQAKLTSKQAKNELGICDDELSAHITKADVLTWIAYPLETLCMADYSFSSNYITGRPLPARPANLACDRFLETPGGGLKGIRAAIGVMYNDTGKVKCYHVPDRREASFYDGLWDQYWCRWMIPQETYFAMRGPPNDMFVPLPFDWKGIVKHCNETVGAIPDRGRAVFRWFGAISEKDWEKKASNIVFANGGHDPWLSGGYFSKSNPTLVPLWIPTGAHHAELMFAKESDPDDLHWARQVTLRHLRKWLGLAKQDYTYEELYQSYASLKYGTYAAPEDTMEIFSREDARFFQEQVVVDASEDEIFQDNNNSNEAVYTMEAR